MIAPKTYACERQTKPRHPDGTDYACERRASSRLWRDRAKWRDEQQSAKRNQRRRECNRRKAVTGIKRSARRRAGRVSDVHCRSDLRQDGASIPRSDEREPPDECARDDEALRRAEHRAAQ